MGNNCLLWLEGPLDSNNRYGASWGGASCNVRQQKAPKYTNQFNDIGSGKCTVNNGRDPKSQFLAGTNENQCKRACRRNKSCSGYSAAPATNNCLLWLEGPLDSNNRYGASWGGASCNVRQQKAPKYTNQFNDIGSGKCTVNNGRDPNSQFLAGTNE